MDIGMYIGLFALSGFLLASFYIYWCLLELIYEIPDFKYRKALPNAFIFLVICVTILSVTIFDKIFF